ncbi:MAG TPA: sodium/solute symporter [Anaerohalosphaeraceae bacterium]|nr:sodium/solute symporter [Anaerohalosphaeraceae bacterium]HRT49329.1 sodium/solute symporter [Anaerohalosphaeraceae bacterium]HRT85942.1 sodium/solute symporter [Anaerohalosphaeraceae bacterium]
MILAQALGENLDYAVMFGYFIAIMGFGLCFSRYNKTTKDYFFGGQRFSWWLIAFSCIATLVGSYSFIKYSAAGFTYGISSTQTYFNDWFWVPLLVLVWIPIVYYRRIQSIPEYMEVRFNKATRVAATVIILLYIVGYIGINLVTLGQALHTLLGWKVMTGAAVTAVAVAIYVYAGGQTAVIMTDLAQGIILLIAGLGLFVGGIYHFGGFGDIWALLPQSHKYAFSEFANPPEFSFIGIYVQDALANTGALMLMHQGFIMRFLSLKSVHDSRRMVVAWILILTPLAAIATSCGGWIAKALVNSGELQTSAGDSFVKAAHLLCRPGVFGFILAALTAALMSTADSLINATSAIFVNDIWRPYIKRNATDKHYLIVARITSLAAAGLGLALVPVFMQKTLYSAHGMFTAAVTPPVVVAIFLGITWRRFTPWAAFATVIGGALLVGASFFWPDALVGLVDFGMGPDSYDFMRALFGLIASAVVGVAVTFVTRPKPIEQIKGLVAGTQLDAMREYKGGEPNRRPGSIARVVVRLDPAVPEGTVMVSRKNLDTMSAEPGDLLYANHARWIYGGLRSVHVKAGPPLADGDEIRMNPADAEIPRFSEGQQITLEKIL